MSHYFSSDPIIISGVGGSGTRIVAELIKQMGIFIGSDLNHANDNMQIARSFPQFRDRIQNNILTTPSELQIFISSTLDAFEKQMYQDFSQQTLQTKGWGWKIPGNFFILDYLVEYFGQFKYIHTIRHGVDMAYSHNQNQLHNWGNFYGVDVNNLPVAKASLQYWIRANIQILEKINQLFNKKNVLLLNFDHLCLYPEENIQILIDFLELKEVDAVKLAKLVKIPESLGRYKQQDLSIFDQNELDAVKQLGFEIA